MVNNPLDLSSQALHFLQDEEITSRKSTGMYYLTWDHNAECKKA